MCKIRPVHALNGHIQYYLTEDCMITLHTSHGDISIELDFDKAPNTAANFLQYAKDGFYEGTIFHRVISTFMIQGGGMIADMSEKEGSRASIENEADNDLTNDLGTLAMARTSDPHSASSQFFINVADNGFLNHSGKNQQGWGYAVFGKVTGAMDAVEKIKGLPTGNRAGHGDVPTETITIDKVTISEAYADK
ncbi:MAG: peptidyl-prolyl cis-trans isomerase B (cyclophilin B) [Pseudomonadales bacterium]|jgi:peptidyl-prolyl cis-trans isomerase B (cyclophilin B)